MSKRWLPLQNAFNPVVAAGVPATSLWPATSCVLLVKCPPFTTFKHGPLQEFFPWVACSSSLVGPSDDRSVCVKRPAMNQSIDLKLPTFSSLPCRSSAQSASDRQNRGVRSDWVRDVGPCVDGLRRRDVQTRRKDVVRKLHRLSDTLFVRWRRLGREEKKFDWIVLLFLILFATTVEITVALCVTWL